MFTLLREMRKRFASPFKRIYCIDCEIRPPLYICYKRSPFFNICFYCRSRVAVGLSWAGLLYSDRWRTMGQNLRSCVSILATGIFPMSIHHATRKTTNSKVMRLLTLRETVTRATTIQENTPKTLGEKVNTLRSCEGVLLGGIVGACKARAAVSSDQRRGAQQPRELQM